MKKRIISTGSELFNARPARFSQLDSNQRHVSGSWCGNFNKNVAELLNEKPDIAVGFILYFRQNIPTIVCPIATL